jgi:hypothetical protein
MDERSPVLSRRTSDVCGARETLCYVLTGLGSRPKKQCEIEYLGWMKFWPQRRSWLASHIRGVQKNDRTLNLQEEFLSQSKTQEEKVGEGGGLADTNH